MSRAVELWTLARTFERFNPAQPRDGEGQWTAGLGDKLKLAGKLDLAPDETLIGSDKVSSSDTGIVRLAVIGQNGRVSLRLGIGGSDFGTRDDESGPWRASPDQTEAVNMQRRPLRQEEQSLEAELERLGADPHADPDRLDAIQARLMALEDVDTGEVYSAGYTARLNQGAVGELRSALDEPLATAVERHRQVNADFDGLPELDRQLDEMDADPDGSWSSEHYEAVLAERRAVAGRLKERNMYEIFAEGFVTGEWADVHYRIEMDDPSVDVQTTLAAIPHGSGRTLDDLNGQFQTATFTPGETRKFLRQLGRLTSGERPRGATEADTNPGNGDRLKRYWLRGEGLAKWAPKPHPWTSLYRHILKHVENPEKAKRIASDWFFEHFGFHAGSDKNRVMHGKPPRGERVGPG